MIKVLSGRLIPYLFVITLISACSDSGTEGSFEPPPIIEPVTQPFFADGALYGFFNTIIDEDTAEYQTVELLRPSSGIMVALDTDQSTEAEGEPNEKFLQRSAIPEYVVYADEAMLYAYELATQHTHTIFDFRAERLKNASIICDLQPSVRLDEENLEEDRIVFADEEAVYVRASTTSCSSTVASDYLHYKVTFVDGTEFYSIRVEEETEDEEGETQTSIETKRFLELVGQRKPVDRALMYARAPIADLTRDRIGYLGFDPDTYTWKFYRLNLENGNVRLVWTLTDAGFATQIPFLTRSAFPSSNFFPDRRQANFSRISANAIAMAYGQSIIRLELDHLFDDDRHTERTNSLANPVYTFESTDPNLTYVKYESNGTWIIRDGNRILSVDAAGSQRLLRDLTAESLQGLQVFTTQSSVGLVKEFSDNSYAATLVAKSEGLEKTLIPRTSRSFFLRPVGTNNHIFVEQRATPGAPNITARFIDSGKDEIVPPYDHSIWSFFYSLKGRETSIFSPTVATAQTTVFSPQTAEQVLFEPDLHTFKTNSPIGRDTFIANVPDTVGYIDQLWEYNEDYGVARIVDGLENRNSYKLYYFDPIDFEKPPSDDTDEDEEEVVRLRVMLPMYDSENPPLSE